MANKKKNIFKDPGIIMAIIQMIGVVIIFVWFPTNPGWYGIPMINWLMVIAFFVWIIQSIIFMFWAEQAEGKNNE